MPIDKETEQEKKKSGSTAFLNDIEKAFEFIQGSTKQEYPQWVKIMPRAVMAKIGPGNSYIVIFQDSEIDEGEKNPSSLFHCQYLTGQMQTPMIRVSRKKESHVIPGGQITRVTEYKGLIEALKLEEQRGERGMKQVIFKGDDKKESEQGYSLLLRSGPVIYTDKEGEYIVPVESIKMLKEEGIKCTVREIGEE
jgi:hypothetical protein